MCVYWGIDGMSRRRKVTEEEEEEEENDGGDKQEWGDWWNEKCEEKINSGRESTLWTRYTALAT